MKRLAIAVLQLLLVLLADLAGSAGSVTCSATDSDQCGSRASPKYPAGVRLRPSDLPGPSIFANFDKNFTVDLPGGKRQVAEGKVTQINKVDGDVAADVAVVTQAVERTTVDQMLQLLRAYEEFDQDPDTVDGMPSYEMFIDNPDLYSEKPSLKHLDRLDSDPEALKGRIALREKLTNLTRPYLDGILTPFIRERYPLQCARGNGRDCTPCYSLIRRYRHGERQSHAPHFDGHALATVVVSLSDYGVDYRGGLYVGTGYGQREHLALMKGDAAVHRSTLVHGVQVYDVEDEPERTERWSWILWYLDSERCEDHSHQWFDACAHDGNALCQMLHATKVGSIPGISPSDAQKAVLELNTNAANGGAAASALKVARAYLKKIPSELPLDVEMAKRYFKMAIESNHPDGHYGLAQILISEVAEAEVSGEVDPSWKKTQMSEAVSHLEEAAMTGHAFSAYNLGIAHTFGYGMPDNKVDTILAKDWFVQSGLPEGYFLAAAWAASIEDEQLQTKYEDLARALGFWQDWREQARQRTGSGGAPGVDLNIRWPMSTRGIMPPKL